MSRTANTETLWQEISIAALLGTQRKPYHPEPVEGELGSILHAAAAIDGERGLLYAASATALHRRAGRLPEIGEAAFPVACPPDDRPRCTPKAAACLKQILAARKPVLLQEWVDLANLHQQRIAEELIPELLGQQKSLQSFRRALTPVLGQRGQWLAAQNPDWHSFAHILDPRWWDEGTRKERLLFLSDLRASDPDQARELLQSTWAKEALPERLSFLPLLEDQLSMADEPFLEAVLEDRRKDVRQIAARLLSRLPESRFVQRMTSRAQACLTWKTGLLRSALEITLPETCDAAMQRDGIEASPAPSSSVSERARWLSQILAGVPPDTWTTAWGRRPAQILDALRKDPLEDAVLQGLREAAFRCQNTEWLEVFAWFEYRRGKFDQVMEFFPRLPAETQENFTLTLLNDHPSLSYDSAGAICLAACRHPWGEAITQTVLTTICWTLRRSDLPPWRWEKLLRDIAPYFHPSLLEESIERIGAALERTGIQNPPASYLLDVLEFRLEMRRAFLDIKESS